MDDLYMLKLMKFCSNSMYMTHLVSTELSVLHQLIRLLNCIYTQYPERIEKVKYKTHTYYDFSYNIKETICRNIHLLVL